jgi:hypothetical protein
LDGRRDESSSVQKIDEQQPLNRRRALRVLGALAAGAAALAATKEPASATSGLGLDGNLVIGSNDTLNTPNTARELTEIEPAFLGWILTSPPALFGANASAAITGGPTDMTGAFGAGRGTGAGLVGLTGIVVDSTHPPSLTGVGAGVAGGGKGGADGVVGVSDIGNGVHGVSFGVGPGVFGQAAASGVSGVIGQNGGSGGGDGVQGFSTVAAFAGVEGDNLAGGTAVLGVSSSGSSDSSVGVYGKSTGTKQGIGVLGLSSNDSQSVGVYGQSATGTGFLGFSNAIGGVGSSAVNSTSGIGVYAESNGGYAGIFKGNVYVTGSLTVVGSYPKSAAVRGADGGLKRLYCMESPECWFEDFGKGKLSGGSATVQLDPEFAALVHGDNYHVFPAARGDSKGLYVSDQTATGFTVREQQGGTTNIGFSYRVVAKRKDIEGARLEHVAEPPVPPIPLLTKLPDQPATSPPPQPPVSVGHLIH